MCIRGSVGGGRRCHRARGDDRCGGDPRRMTSDREGGGWLACHILLRGMIWGWRRMLGRRLRLGLCCQLQVLPRRSLWSLWRRRQNTETEWTLIGSRIIGSRCPVRCCPERGAGPNVGECQCKPARRSGLALGPLVDIYGGGPRWGSGVLCR